MTAAEQVLAYRLPKLEHHKGNPALGKVRSSGKAYRAGPDDGDRKIT
jgi:hypothetical protein